MVTYSTALARNPSRARRSIHGATSCTASAAASPAWDSGERVAMGHGPANRRRSPDPGGGATRATAHTPQRGGRLPLPLARAPPYLPRHEALHPDRAADRPRGELRTERPR